MDKRDRADERSERGRETDARKGNESVAFAAFYREYVTQTDSRATVAEVRAAFATIGSAAGVSPSVKVTPAIRAYPAFRADGRMVMVTVPDAPNPAETCCCDHAEAAHVAEASGFSPCSGCECEWFQSQAEAAAEYVAAS